MPAFMSAKHQIPSHRIRVRLGSSYPMTPLHHGSPAHKYKTLRNPDTPCLAYTWIFKRHTFLPEAREKTPWAAIKATMYSKPMDCSQDTVSDVGDTTPVSMFFGVSHFRDHTNGWHPPWHHRKGHQKAGVLWNKSTGRLAVLLEVEHTWCLAVSKIQVCLHRSLFNLT